MDTGNKAQQAAVESFRKYLERDIARYAADYGAAISKLEVTATSYGNLHISASTELLGLPEGNLPRALDRTHYFVVVGKRGALTMRMGPDSLKQFQGSKFLGININYC